MKSQKACVALCAIGALAIPAYGEFVFTPGRPNAVGVLAEAGNEMVDEQVTAFGPDFVGDFTQDFVGNLFENHTVATIDPTEISLHHSWLASTNDGFTFASAFAFVNVTGAKTAFIEWDIDAPLFGDPLFIVDADTEELYFTIGGAPSGMAELEMVPGINYIVQMGNQALFGPTPEGEFSMSVVMPAPSALALLGLAGVARTRRRRIRG